MSAIDPGLVTSKTLARHLFDAGLAPDGVRPVMHNGLVFSRLVQGRDVPWSPATEIGDVWHLVLRYRINLLLSEVRVGEGRIYLRIPLRQGLSVEACTPYVAHEEAIPLEIGRLALRLYHQELTEDAMP